MTSFVPETHSQEIVDRVARFKAFYAEAAATPLDEGARWALWKKEYGIAAVPPGPEGDKIARQLLHSAWAKYPALMPKIPALQEEAEAGVPGRPCHAHHATSLPRLAGDGIYGNGQVQGLACGVLPQEGRRARQHSTGS